MKPSVLVFAPDLYPLGECGPLRMFVESQADRFDFHIVFPRGVDWDEPINKHVRIYRMTSREGIRFGRELGRITAAVSPNHLINWCGPLKVDLTWATFRKPVRHSAFLSLASAQWQLRRQPCLPGSVLLPAGESTVRTGALKVWNRREPEIIRYSFNPVQPNPESSERVRLDWERDFGIARNSPVAIASAPLSPRSKIRDLIWAADLYCCVQEDFHLIVLGRGNDHSRLERFVGLCERSANVHWGGHPDNAADWLAASSIFWQSAVHPTSLAGIRTAMRCGIPVITVPVKDPAQGIRNMVTAIEIEPNSQDGFARWTKYLIEQPEQCGRMVSQARRIAEELPLQDPIDRRFAELLTVGTRG